MLILAPIITCASDLLFYCKLDCLDFLLLSAEVKLLTRELPYLSKTFTV